MKKLFNTTAIILSLGIAITGCRKNDTIVTPDQSSMKLKEFFKNNAPQFETFSINASTGGLIISSKGTKYSIGPNSLVDANGNVVTGNVDILVKEISNASEMILSNKPATTTNGQVLESFGEFQVKAQKAGVDLKLRQDSAIRVQVKPFNPATGGGMLQQMPLWSGDSTVTFTTNGYNDDNQATTLTGSYAIPKGMTWNQIAGQQVTAGGGYYNFKIDSLIRWSNCDALASQPGTPTTVLGYLGNKFNPATGGSMGNGEPSMLFYKVRNVNTMAKLYNMILNPAPGKEGFLSYQNSFRIGGQGTFLAISAKDNKFYAEMLDVTIPTPASGKNYVPFTFNMQEVSESTLLILIQQMNTK